MQAPSVTRVSVSIKLCVLNIGGHLQGPCLGLQRHAGLENQYGGHGRTCSCHIPAPFLRAMSETRAVGRNGVLGSPEDAHIAVSGLGEELCEPWSAHWQFRRAAVMSKVADGTLSPEARKAYIYHGSYHEACATMRKTGTVREDAHRGLRLVALRDGLSLFGVFDGHGGAEVTSEQGRRVGLGEGLGFRVLGLGFRV